MNEALIKELIRCKLSAADAILNSLPPEVSDKIKELGRLILESVNESCKEIDDKPIKKSKDTDKLDNIPIE